MDSRIYAALITSFIALVVSVINLIVTNNRSKNEAIKRREFEQNLEKQRFLYQLELMNTTTMSHEEIKLLNIKQSHQKEILEGIQMVKDRIYRVILKERLIDISKVNSIGESIDEFTKIYQKSYTEFDELEQKWLHDLKSLFHDCFLTLEELSINLDKKVAIEKTIEHLKVIQTKLSIYQKWYKDYVKK